MDADIVKLVKSAIDNPAVKVDLRLIDEASGEIEAVTDQGTQRLKLKPLAELFGQGLNKSTVDPLDDDYLSLFHAIEAPIVRYYQSHPALTDASVLLTLERLGMNPQADPAGDELAREVQLSLRMLLSVNDHSRQEVRAAVRKVAKSVARHTRLAGPRGYLSFIVEYVPS